MSTFISHAQNFEDVMLWRALKNVRDGFYIDVGAASPESSSVTKAFYDRGWSGINIEPNPTLWTTLAELRPRDVNLRIALSDRPGHGELHVFGTTGLSSLDDGVAAMHVSAGRQMEKTIVEVSTLSDVWREHAGSRNVHFLKIDVEGWERQVLLGNDWLRNRPWILVIEATVPMSTVESHDHWETIVLGANYKLVYKDGLNRFYVAEEHPELVPAFSSPPNVFDDFVVAGVPVLEAQLADAVVRLRQATSELHAARTQSIAIRDKYLRIKRSRSWRLTRPLRRALRFGKKIKSRVGLEGRRPEQDGQHLRPPASPARTSPVCRDSSQSLDTNAPRPVHDSAGRPTAGTIWMDVTTILRWRRPAVGIVRVELQLVRWILKHDELVQFCRYDPAARAVVDVDRQQVAEHADFLGRISRYTSPAPHDKSLVKTKRPKRLLKRILRSVRKVLRQGGRATGVFQTGATTPRPSVFQNGDVYISVGSAWDDNDLGQLLERKQHDGIKVLSMCYDMIPTKFPHLTVPQFKGLFPRYIANVARVADHVLCISKCTQADFIEATRAMQCPTPETSVIRLGSDLPQAAAHAAGASQDEATLSIEVANAAASPFVLFVSTIERRKNHETLYKAWVRLIETGRPIPNLVCVGSRGWGVDDLLSDLARDPRIRGRIHVLHAVSDAELTMLYKRCLYTVYPSLYEGWGLPVVESFGFGKFCLCSNTGSLPEAGGDLAEYLDPWDLNAWIARIQFFADHPNEVECRNRRVAESFHHHSWHKTSHAIMLKARALARKGPPPEA